MDLLYCWIENYANIKKQGFNFSTCYRFIYNSVNKTFDRDYIKYIDINFFNLQQNFKSECNITNIIGIVGENGAGKTSVLEFIQNNIAFSFGVLRYKSIFILKSNKGIIVYYHDDLLDIENQKLKNYADIIDYKCFSGDEGPQYNPDFQNITFAFYSNIFDNKFTERLGTDFYNISTNYLARYDKTTSVENYSFPPKTSQLEIHRICEFQRDINFLKSYNNYKNLPVKLPEKVSLKINPFVLDEYYFNEYINDKTHPIDIYVKKVVNVILSSLSYKNYSLISKFKIDFYTAYIKKYFYDNYAVKFVPYHGNQEKVTLELKKIITFFELQTEKNIELAIEKFFTEDNNEIKAHIRWCEFFTVMLKIIKHIREPLNVSISISQAYKLTELANNLFVVPDIFIFDWYDLSSGEKAMLSLYSRFNSIVEECEKFSNIVIHKNMIILVDEGELYLHPQWQKGFILTFINMVKFIFAKYKTDIQIILTSNSPFILSDLPKNNVIKLKNKNLRHGNNCTVEDEYIEDEQTFGQNIHTLLSKSFFLDDTIGEFARMKIKKVTDELNELEQHNDNLGTEKLNKIYEVISIVGEPLIKSALLEKYSRITGNSNSEVLLEVLNQFKQLNHNDKKLLIRHIVDYLKLYASI